MIKRKFCGRIEACLPFVKSWFIGQKHFLKLFFLDCCYLRIFFNFGAILPVFLWRLFLSLFCQCLRSTSFILCSYHRNNTSSCSCFTQGEPFLFQSRLLHLLPLTAVLSCPLGRNCRQLTSPSCCAHLINSLIVKAGELFCSWSGFVFEQMNTNVFYLGQCLGGWSRHLVLPLKSTNNSLSPLQICLGTLVLRHGCLTDICILLTNGKHCLNILSSVPKRKIKTAPTFSWISLPAENMPVLHVYVSILVVGFLTTSGGKKSDHLAGSSASG